MDCTFQLPEGKFNYRVGAIILNDCKVLMAKNDGDSYYYSVGGRVKLHESMEQAVLRECREETGISFGIDRLGFIHENFFIEESTKERVHELCMFYYMKPNPQASAIPSYFYEGTQMEKLEWLPIDRLNAYQIYPEFFKTELVKPQMELVRIVTNDIEFT